MLCLCFGSESRDKKNSISGGGTIGYTAWMILGALWKKDSFDQCNNVVLRVRLSKVLIPLGRFSYIIR